MESIRQPEVCSFDLTDRQFAKNYLDLLHHPLKHRGRPSGGWTASREQYEAAGVNPTWWLNYIHLHRPGARGKRPLSFIRWGGLGNHRYQIGFSETRSPLGIPLRSTWFTATAAHVGYAYWSHDIGGHMPGVIEPELYTRWIQFGIFSRFCAPTPRT